jgi:hypothetical protein
MDRRAVPLISRCSDPAFDTALVLVELDEAHLLDASAPARCRIKHGRSEWRRGVPALADYVRGTRGLRAAPAPERRACFELSCEHQRQLLRGLLTNLHGHAPALSLIDAWLEHFALANAIDWITIACCPDALIAKQLQRIGLDARQSATLLRTECGPAPLGWVAAADPRALDHARELYEAARRAPVQVIDLVKRTCESFPSFFRAAKSAMKRVRAGAGPFDIIVGDFTYVRVVQPGRWFGRWPADANDAIQKR